MKYTDLIKELEAQGATFKEGSKHTKVYLNGKQTTILRHREVKETQRSKGNDGKSHKKTIRS